VGVNQVLEGIDVGQVSMKIIDQHSTASTLKYT